MDISLLPPPATTAVYFPFIPYIFTSTLVANFPYMLSPNCSYGGQQKKQNTTGFIFLKNAQDWAYKTGSCAIKNWHHFSGQIQVSLLIHVTEMYDELQLTFKPHMKS